MHSPAVSFFSRSAVKMEMRIFSTENSGLNLSGRIHAALWLNECDVIPAELPLVPEAWAGQDVAPESALSASAKVERMESVLQVNPLGQNSYQNENRIGAFAGLLKDANTSEISIFNDRQRSKKAAAGNVVMERGVEHAARGCDAV